MDEHELRDLLEHAAVGIHLIGPDGTVLWANAAELEMLGYGSSEYVGHPIAQFHADPEILADILTRLRNGEVVRGYEAQMIRRDGSFVEVAIDCSARVVDGDFQYARCFITETTGRLQVEEAALRLSTIVESSQDAIVSKDLNGIVKTWNAGAERIFGFTADEAVGKSIRIIIPEDRQSEEDGVLEKVRSGQRVEHFETVRRRKDGSPIDISLTVSPIKDRLGRIIGASKIARDITARKKAEEAFRQSVAMKDDFLSLVSHELRTPVAVMVGGARLLRHRFDSLSVEDREETFADLEAHGVRLQEIIEHLLLLTRMDSDADLPVEYIRLERVTEEVVHGLRRRFPERTIEVTPAKPLPIGLGSIPLTKLLIENLVSNALKYSPADQPVEVMLSSSDPSSVTIEVLDRGIGLAPEDIDRLFDPFFRSQTAQRKASGMGLGLAVCKKIVDAIHGEICARPRPGGGACFTATLPAEPIFID